MSLEDLIAASQFFNICFFHRVDAVGGSRQLCGTVSNGLVGWEGPGVVWEMRRSITSHDGKPTEKVIYARILLCSQLFRLQGYRGWNEWQKTGREWEHIRLALPEHSCRVSWTSFESFLNLTEFQLRSLCEGEFGGCILTGVFFSSCGPVREYKSQVYSKLPRNSLQDLKLMKMPAYQPYSNLA